jgi:hypothetical protein
MVEDRLLRDGIASLLDEEVQKVEVLWYQRNGESVSQEQPLARRQDEPTESKQNVRRHRQCAASW